MHGVQLRSRSLGHRQPIPPNMDACIGTFDRQRGPGHVGQHFGQHTEYRSQGATEREHYQRDVQCGDGYGLL